MSLQSLLIRQLTECRSLRVRAKRRRGQEKFRCECMAVATHNSTRKATLKNATKNRCSRSSRNIAPLKVLTAVAMLYYLAISSYIWVNVTTKSEWTSRLLRRRISSTQFMNISSSNDRPVVELRFIPMLFQQNVFDLIRKVAAPPSKSFNTSDWEPDYNDLYFDSLPGSDFIRSIMYYDERIEVYSVDEEVDNSDDLSECYALPWTKLQFPVCNTLHELVIDTSKDLYLGHGYYRDAWLFQDDRPLVDPKTGIVLKRMVMPIDDDDVSHLVNAESLGKIHKEALIMERLTSSPRIINIYGHCGTSVLAEDSEDGVAESIVPDSGHANRTILEQLPYIPSFNSLTALEKLDIAIAMSMAIADLHGFSDGIIVHGDIHPVQWLISRANGGLQLNDFNNAEILNIQRHQTTDNTTYCKTDRGNWYGVFRSPEEYLGDPIDEQIDVYSMGNTIYALLTGLWPFYDITDYDNIKDRVVHSERPYIDPRYYSNNSSFIERKMIEIMELMWNDSPHRRPTIFEVVTFLSNVQRQAQRAKPRKWEIPSHNVATAIEAKE